MRKKKIGLVLRAVLPIALSLILNEGIALSQDGYFHYPYGIAIDPSGNLYVTDTNNRRIQKFDSNGNFITKWGSYGDSDGQFDSPYGIAVDSSGNVYVADRNNRRIQKFDSNGNFIAKWGSDRFRFPRGVTIDSSNNLYVTDFHSDCIQKFDSNGNFITKWGGHGNGDDQFSFPCAIATDPSGNVYVTDMNNHRIQKFDSDGNFITKWGGHGDNDGQFEEPLGIAVDPSGNVYTTEFRNSRIQKFDSNGNFITKWKGYKDNNQFSRPSPCGVAIDSVGNIYVTDNINHHIQKFDQNGNFITKWGSLGDVNAQFHYPSSELILANFSEPLGDTLCGREVFEYDTTTYILSYECRGDTFIDNVKIIDYLDSGLSPLSYSGEYDPYSHTITWHLGRLGPNDSGTFIIICQVTANPGSCIKNYTTISADNIDNIPKDILTHHVMQVSPPVIYLSPHSSATAADHLGDVVVYPNPFKPYKNHERIYFGHPTDSARKLTREMTIKIYDIVGALVKTIEESDGDGEATWDGKNEDEKDVASGIYIYYITNPEGEKCVGKIGIIR